MPAELPHPALPGFAFSTPRRIRHSAAGWLLALLLGLLSGAATTALAQTPAAPPECAADEKFANTWYFGYRAGLDFNQATDSIPPKVLTDGAMEAPAGAGVMSDSNGKILFYSNGETVWNGDGTVMTNGTGLAGNRLTTDGPLPIRMPGTVLPGQPTRYLLFTLNSTVGLSYSEIDIPAGGGAGTLIAATKNTPLARGTAEKLTGVFHKNGCDIWVITHGWGAAKTGRNNRGDAFLAYRVRLTTGVDTIPIISPVGSLHAPSVSPVGYRGQLKVTPDGQRLALARYSEVLGDSSSTVELFGFDTGTGQVSANPRVPYVVDKGEGKYYGVEFSAGSYLYATVLNPPQLLQFDISGQGPVTRQVIPLKQTTPADLGSLQAAPDGKIYVARDNQPALGFIAYPDSLGAKARYADDSLQLGGRLSGRGLVNFNQSSLLRVGPGAEITGCRQISFTSPQIDFDGKTYAWTFGDGATSTEANPVHIYATPGDYTITLRITTACFCRQSSGSIRVPNLPEPGSIAGPQVLCAGTAPTILASTAAGSSDAGLPLLYQWEASPDNVTFSAIGGATGPSYLPANLPVGTTYFRRRAQLLLPNGSGPYCTPRFTAAVAITVVPALGAGAIAASQTVCVGAAAAPLTSTAAATGGTGTLAYQWEASADNLTFAPIGGATGDTYAPGVLASTTYFRRRVSSGPCGPLYSNVVTISVLPVLSAGTIAADQTICAGSTPSPLTSTLGASGGAGSYAYQWEASTDNNTFTTIGGAIGATYAPGTLTATTYYRRRVTSGTGSCAGGMSNVVAITVQPLLVPTVSLPTPPVQCAGTALTFAATTTNVGAAPTFRWLVNGAAMATGPTFTSSTLATGDQVQVEVTPTAGLCTTGPVAATVTVTRTPIRQPTLNISLQPAAPVCPGEPITFSIAVATDTGPSPQYQWQVNGADVAGATGPVFTSTTLRAGQTVTLRLRTTDACGQPAAATSNGVVVRLLPPVVLSAGPDKEILLGSSVVLEGSADGNYPVTWTPALGLTIPPSDPLHPVAAPTVTTTYTLSGGTGGCASSDEVTVTVRPGIRIPNAFTPNGDGRDDTWQIEFIEQYPDNTVSVFNRWGNRVFSTQNYSRANEWHGDINGQPAPTGTYYYVVTTRGPLGRSYSGSLTILY